MRPLRYSINVTLDGCCDHREGIADEDIHRHAAENLDQADALLFGRVTYEMMEEAWRRPAPDEPTSAEPQASSTSDLRNDGADRDLPPGGAMRQRSRRATAVSQRPSARRRPRATQSVF